MSRQRVRPAISGPRRARSVDSYLRQTRVAAILALMAFAAGVISDVTAASFWARHAMLASLAASVIVVMTGWMPKGGVRGPGGSPGARRVPGPEEGPELEARCVRILANLWHASRLSGVGPTELQTLERRETCGRTVVRL
jgi:hypothetical protein